MIGGEQDGPPFSEVPFQAVRPAAWWPGNINLRFVAGMIGTLRQARPALIEVHNRPEIALALTWLLLPYVVIGLTWGFFHPAMIAREEAALQTLLPAGAEIVAYGHIAVLWPVLMTDPGVCPV